MHVSARSCFLPHQALCFISCTAVPICVYIGFSVHVTLVDKSNTHSQVLLRILASIKSHRLRFLFDNYTPSPPSLSDYATDTHRSKTHNQHSSQTTSSSCTYAKKKPNTLAKTAQTASDGSPRALNTCCAMYVESSCCSTSPTPTRAPSQTYATTKSK